VSWGEGGGVVSQLGAGLLGGGVKILLYVSSVERTQGGDGKTVKKG